MEEVLIGLGIFLEIVSLISFIVGFVMLFFDKRRKLGLQMMLFSVIGFVIGFSTCVNNNS